MSVWQGPRLNTIIAFTILASGHFCAAEGRTIHAKFYAVSKRQPERAGWLPTLKQEGRKNIAKAGTHRWRYGVDQSREKHLLGKRYLNKPRLSSDYSDAGFDEYPPYGYPFAGPDHGSSANALGFYKSPYVRYSVSPFTGYYGWYGHLNP